MAKKAELKSGRAEKESESGHIVEVQTKGNRDEINKLTRMLAAVLQYLTNEELEELDVEYLFEHTEGLREWWKKYREHNKKAIKEEIVQSLGDLSFEELERIREQIRNHK